MIPLWTVNFTETQALNLAQTLREKHLSQGAVTAELERAIAEKFSVAECICVSSGTSALIVAMLAAGVGPGTEVIVPNRTWIATAHAALILGASVVVCDTLQNSPIMDVNKIEALITKKTRAVVPVFMNGRNIPNYRGLCDLLKSKSIEIIDDAAQAIGSKDPQGQQLGSLGNYGCFSLSVAKLVGSGQGGFILTNDDRISSTMRAIRTHGVENTKEATKWEMIGGNFRYNDLAASLVFDQINNLEERANKSLLIYETYIEGLSGVKGITPIRVDTEAGEIPVYCEFLTDNRESFQDCMSNLGIETRKFYPDIASADYLLNQERNKTVYETSGIYLPSGPDLPIRAVHEVIEAVKNSV